MLADINRTFHSDKMQPTVAIRADANRNIGSGHAMRCISIAQQIEALGGSVWFAVSDGESKAFVEKRGFDAAALHGSSDRLCNHEARALAEFCESCDAVAVLVDSYGVDGAFFSELRARTRGSVRIAYLDDLYTFEKGHHTTPIARPVDYAINYCFDADGYEYQIAYKGSDTHCCIGSRFAPLRPWFVSKDRVEKPFVENVLVTTGATNDDNMLEKMAEGCLRALPSARVDVVVGGEASFNLPSRENVRTHTGLTDLSTLMSTSDLALSAAGTTLYELCAIGVPTIAVPIVENQLPNARGFRKMGLGLVVDTSDHFVDRIASTVEELATDCAKRQDESNRMRSSVDGLGAERIAKLLINA